MLYVWGEVKEENQGDPTKTKEAFYILIFFYI